MRPNYQLSLTWDSIAWKEFLIHETRLKIKGSKILCSIFESDKRRKKSNGSSFSKISALLFFMSIVTWCKARSPYCLFLSFLIPESISMHRRRNRFSVFLFFPSSFLSGPLASLPHPVSIFPRSFNCVLVFCMRYCCCFPFLPRSSNSVHQLVIQIRFATTHYFRTSHRRLLLIRLPWYGSEKMIRGYYNLVYKEAST